MKNLDLSDVLNRLGDYKDSHYPSSRNNVRWRNYEYGKALQSYSTIMAVQILGVYFFHKEDWTYSRTTCKHLRDWCGMTLKEIRSYCKQHPDRVFC